jgi:hypothetical protein
MKKYNRGPISGLEPGLQNMHLYAVAVVHETGTYPCRKNCRIVGLGLLR